MNMQVQLPFVPAIDGLMYIYLALLEQSCSRRCKTTHISKVSKGVSVEHNSKSVKEVDGLILSQELFHERSLGKRLCLIDILDRKLASGKASAADQRLLHKGQPDHSPSPETRSI